MAGCRALTERWGALRSGRNSSSRRGDVRQPDRWSWRPQEGPQYALFICPPKEIFFGGTRGGGKADARSANNPHLASFKRQDCTLVAWDRSLYAPRTRRAYDSPHP